MILLGVCIIITLFMYPAWLRMSCRTVLMKLGQMRKSQILHMQWYQYFYQYIMCRLENLHTLSFLVTLRKTTKAIHFVTDKIHAFVSECESLRGMRFLNSAVDGVSCESKWVQVNIRMFMREQCQHVGIIDTNHNIKNNQYHNLVGSCAAIMRGYRFYPGLLQIEGVPHKMCCLEDFA